MHRSNSDVWWVNRYRRMAVMVLGMLVGTLLGSGVSGSVAAPSAAGVVLQPSLPSGQPVGSVIRWTATAPDAGPHVYQFSLGQAQGRLLVVRDFSPASFFSWTPIEEGDYEVKVRIKAGFGTVAVTEATVPFSVHSRIVEGQAVVTPTGHPLVALYSAPPCQSGGSRVEFRADTAWPWQATSWKPCNRERSTNFFVAGMRADTTYVMQHVTVDGSLVERGPLRTYRTGTPTRGFPQFAVLDPIDARSSLTDDVLFQSVLSVFRPEHTITVATDLAGRVLWYYDKLLWSVNRGFAYATRPLAGGTVLILASCCNLTGNLLYEIDLAGNTLRQTNADRVNEQLSALGEDRILGMHHDAMRLPNGDTLVLGMLERTISQPGAEPLPTLGDMIIALDDNWQVKWTWNAFKKLDVGRKAVLNETCLVAYGPVCAASTDSAHDWLHSNSIAYSPSDGNLLLSMRHQDWVIKIDYRNGTGTGDVIWRLGKGGDFQLPPGTPASSWFSHQHDARYVGVNQIAVFDNGNTRCAPTGPPIPGCHSRGQVLEIDEARRTATLALNADLGNYSERQGSAEKLQNGNFNFMSGYELKFGSEPTGPFSRSIEVQPDGAVNSVLATGESMYRSYRMRSLYHP